MSVYRCVLCAKDRPGRFTRRQEAASGGWSQGFTKPAWYCWTCLPKGQGRDEEEEPMAKKTPAKKALPVIDVPPTTPTNLLADRREGMALQTSLQTDVSALTGIATTEQYVAADTLFGRIKQARKTWNLKMYGTKEKPGPIPNLRVVLDQLYALNREVDKPLEDMEAAVEKEMKAFKLEERRQLLAKNEERQREEEETRKRIEDLAARKEAVKTTAAKNRLEEQLEQAEGDLTNLQLTPQPEAVQGANSSDRPKKVVNIPDTTAFIKGVSDGVIPEDCLTINMVRVRAYFKEDPEAVAMFPGVSIDDDIQIVGRG